MNDGFHRYQPFIGDLHNHCSISYGHGELEDALRNAQLQLDFVSITGHAGWPDMGKLRMPEPVVNYHKKGFAKLKTEKDRYDKTLEACNKPGRFVTFSSYELHSFEFGDYTVLQRQTEDSFEIPENIEQMRVFLKETSAERDGRILFPHHIGYKTGFRGIYWNSFSEQASPLVEIFSMHGCSESPRNPFPYLHTMGPLDSKNTMQSGLSQGHMFGVIASTDHHSAHPGSYGHGRVVAWAESLNREDLWDAFINRRTYALSGDKIMCKFSLDGYPMGSVVPWNTDKHPELSLEVEGRDALSRIEIVKNATVIMQKNYIPTSRAVHQSESIRGKVLFEFGWGEKGELFNWDIEIHFHNAIVKNIEPQLRGKDVVDPLDTVSTGYSFSTLDISAEKSVHLRTATWGNPTPSTSQTQRILVDLECVKEDQIDLWINGTNYHYKIADLIEDDAIFYTSGFVSPAVKIHRFIFDDDCYDQIRFVDKQARINDVYYARVLQVNGQMAWSSPIKII
jgi:hypothetical protein